MLKVKKKENNKGGRSFFIWMIVAVVLLVGSYAAFLGWKSKPSKHQNHQNEVEKKVEEVMDPVCKMMVKPPAAGHAVYKGKTYYFCSIPCKEDFKKKPEKYLKEQGKKEVHK